MTIVSSHILEQILNCKGRNPLGELVGN